MPDRDEVIQGLRDLAHLLVLNPDIPTPSVSAAYWMGERDDVAKVLAAVRPEPQPRSSGESYVRWERPIAPGVTYRIYTPASAVLVTPAVVTPDIRPELLAAARGEAQPILAGAGAGGPDAV